MQDGTLALVVGGATVVNIVHNWFWMRVNKHTAQSVEVNTLQHKTVKSDELSKFKDDISSKLEMLKKEVLEKLQFLETERRLLTSRVDTAEAVIKIANERFGSPDVLAKDMEKLQKRLEDSILDAKQKLEEFDKEVDRMRDLVVEFQRDASRDSTGKRDSGFHRSGKPSR